jgi:pimeloyl-ACP methyl ester carboxylesterase
MIEDARGNIDYAEEGSGPIVVLVPGSWGARAAWRPMTSSLGGRFRFVTTSLLGYGGTTERRSEGDISIDHEADIIESVIHRAGDAVHLVGHSYGAQACLALAIRGSAPLLSLCLIEPTGLNLLRRAGELKLYEEMLVVRDTYFHAFESGDKHAARQVIDLHDGHGSFDALPPRVRDYILATTATNVLDWRSNWNMDFPLEVYSAITVPSLIIRGGRGHPYVSRSSEILSSTIPNAVFATVAGGAHSLMITHPGELAGLVGEQISKAEALK